MSEAMEALKPQKRLRYLTPEEREKLVKQIGALRAKGLNAREACAKAQVLYSTYMGWITKRGAHAGAHKATRKLPRKPYKKRLLKEPPQLLTIPLPSAKAPAPFVFISGEASLVREALEALRGGAR